MIVEKAEVICYFMLIQKIKMAGGLFSNAIEPLSLNMKDEENMAEWVRKSDDSPALLSQLWPKIQSTIVSVFTTIYPHRQHNHNKK